MAQFNDGSPIYRQIAEQIKGQILAGSLTGDERVMSTNEYAAAYRINPATAAKAFTQLVDEGILYKQRGVGMFVSADAPDRLRQQHRDRFFTDVVDPMVDRAHTLGIRIEDVIAHLKGDRP
jgi:DNA-binding transcriptional regulator YhcF (GntR family)